MSEAGTAGTAAPDPALREQALALGQRLPAIWADPQVSREHRKALLRCLVEKVVLQRIARDAARVRIVWHGGAVSEMTVPLPVNALTAMPRGAEMEARVLELARAGKRDDEIIHILSAEGHRSPWCSTAILPSTIRGIRLRHGIKMAPRCTRWPRLPDWLTVSAMAARTQIPEKWIRARLRSGVIQTKREASGRYLFPDTAEALDSIRRLRSGAVEHIDLRASARQKEGHQHG
jgi:hypothetical protein